MDHLRCPDRRCVLVAGAAGTAALLTGCSTYGAEQSAPAPASAAGSTGGEALAALADVPVGGGIVLADAKLVVTRPDDATLKAFTAVCTHAGCVVSEVADGTIRCTCHGSEFSAADGSVTGGPAPGPLAEVPVTVQGDQVVRG